MYVGWCVGVVGGGELYYWFGELYCCDWMVVVLVVVFDGVCVLLCFGD